MNFRLLDKGKIKKIKSCKSKRSIIPNISIFRKERENFGKTNKYFDFNHSY